MHASMYTHPRLKLICFRSSEGQRTIAYPVSSTIFDSDSETFASRLATYVWSVRDIVSCRNRYVDRERTPLVMAS